MKADYSLETALSERVPTQPLVDPTILWTRGEHCRELAGILSPTACHVEGDLTQACIEARADLLVTARASSFGLVSTAVPHGIDPDRKIPVVVGAVGTGPHSPLVANLTGLIAAGLGADAVLVTVSRSDAEDEQALATLGSVDSLVPGAGTKVVRADTATGLVDSLPADALLVVGAPGGSWWQRQFFGPGRRLIHLAPAGSVVAKAAPRRCFQAMDDITPLGRHMQARDALAVMSHPAAAVADDGILVGIVRRSALEQMPTKTVGDLMEPAAGVEADDLIEAADDLAGFMEGSPIPVVDGGGRLLGELVIAPSE